MSSEVVIGNQFLLDPALIGRNIRFLRKVAKVRQRDFAKKIGVSQNHLVNIEKGCATPSINLLARIAFAFNKELSYFLNEPPIFEEVRNILKDYTGREIFIALEIFFPEEMRMLKKGYTL
ncbi:MAG: helix-turn-helix transcriptional regulator [Candidatus Yonathbacteria bacterium]|nr:helix-turn-helix transcriptional regulator [Candidatus Yonathbacteria bacterium]NTW47565.1 helix-turn-helix transcriptional regulator [Candidatus Yonathbacteria bacterium]